MLADYSPDISSTWQLLLLLVAVLILVSCVAHKMHQPRYKNWAAYYGADAEPAAFQGYDVLVFDADRHPDIAAVKPQGSKVLAYISLAEIAPYRSYADRFLSDKDMALGYNERWQSNVIDIRNSAWQQFVLDEWLPEMMNKGFDGVFIDTLDAALSLQSQDAQYSGMDEAAVQFIQKIRQRLGRQKLIMVNRAFEILPRIANDIDIVLAESILIDGNSENKDYFPPHIFQRHVDILQSLRQKHSHLSIFTLDYPRTIDKTTWLRVCRAYKNQGFIPFISVMDLQQIQPPFRSGNNSANKWCG